MSLVKLVQGTGMANMNFLTSISADSTEEDCEDALAMLQLLMVSRPHPPCADHTHTPTDHAPPPLFFFFFFAGLPVRSWDLSGG